MDGVPVRRLLLVVAAGLAIGGLVTGCSVTSAPSAEPAANSPVHQHRLAAAPGAIAPTTSLRTTGVATGAVPAPAARPKPVDHCARYRADRLVRVSIRAQHVWLCHHRHTVFQTAVTTGMVGPYTHTPTGHYRIQGRNRDSVLTLNTGAQYDVRYWIPFDAPLFGFHDASWQHFPYGSPRYRTSGSHGCVHMPLRAIRFLYNWAEIGTPVVIS